jgi:hypothetical protein
MKPPTAVQQVPTPPDARDLSSLRADYEDCFVRDVGPNCGRTAEEWARAMLEEAPPGVRGRLRRGWRMLGVRLGPVQARDRVLGWEIRRRDPDVVVLGADSFLGFGAELLFRPQGESLLFATFVEQRTVASRAVWAWLAPTHRNVVQGLLARVPT